MISEEKATDYSRHHTTLPLSAHVDLPHPPFPDERDLGGGKCGELSMFETITVNNLWSGTHEQRPAMWLSLTEGSLADYGKRVIVTKPSVPVGAGGRYRPSGVVSVLFLFPLRT